MKQIFILIAIMVFLTLGSGFSQGQENEGIQIYQMEDDLARAIQMLNKKRAESEKRQDAPEPEKGLNKTQKELSRHESVRDKSHNLPPVGKDVKNAKRFVTKQKLNPTDKISNTKEKFIPREAMPIEATKDDIEMWQGFADNVKIKLKKEAQENKSGKSKGE